MSFEEIFYLSITYIIPIGTIAFFVIRNNKKEKLANANKGPTRQEIFKQVHDLASVIVKGHDNHVQGKYHELVQTIRTSLIMHSQGQTDAEAVLFVLKAAMLKLDDKCLTITTEEQKRAQRVIDGFAKLCRENGFKTA
jgi:hypothetical protein